MVMNRLELPRNGTTAEYFQLTVVVYSYLVGVHERLYKRGAMERELMGIPENHR